MIQNKLKQAQQLEIQIEQLMNQKYQLDLRVKELERTLKELSEVKEDSPVYKAVGPLFFVYPRQSNKIRSKAHFSSLLYQKTMLF